MPDKTLEKAFETEICDHLAAHGWLYSPDDTGYDRERAIFPEDLFGWLQETQPEQFAKLKKMHNGSTEKMFLDRFCDLMEKDGALSVLRHGFKDLNARFELFVPKPANDFNPTVREKYSKMRVRVMRQVHYSTSNEKSIDLVLFINGIPVATLELKTDLTQSVHDAIHQYRNDRWPKDAVTNRNEPLLTFKRGAVVHFAGSTEEVWMTTALKGKDTTFRPFNLGNDGGKGNPPNENGYRTSYLWEQILDRDNWLNIMHNFAYIERPKKKRPNGKTIASEAMIFPRIHQLQAVNMLVNAARDEGPGHTYLVQHSAGSGKTYSISWLAHRLASLHDANDRKVFDSVIVITDRTVLDDQLRGAIDEIEHKQGVVEGITDKDSSKSGKLVKALVNGVPIIIVTLQTFPFILDEIRKQATLKERTFAVIVDEAHSSMGGAESLKLHAVLTAEQLDGGEVSGEDVMLAEAESHPLPPNASFFAFTATPKAKTIEKFGRVLHPDELRSDANPERPFHVYTMQQAIEEGYILDVLKNFTPYKVAWKLAHNGKEYTDREVEETEGLKQIGRWVRLHPYNIAQKVQVIVEHFRHNVAGRLNHEAKAMVVTASRKEAVRYKLALDKYIREQGYTDVAALVAFSGTVNDQESGRTDFTEHNMNPDLKGQDIREAFDTNEFNVLLVANKFQTGFDQPKLMAMYVDKRLSGIAAVQTLSRLNRTYPGKDETFILDFVNEPEEIQAAFEPFYREAKLGGVSDPNILHDLQTKLDRAGIYLVDEAVGYCKTLFDPKQKKQSELFKYLDPARDRFRERQDKAHRENDKKALDALDLFRKDLGTFARAYEFLSQIFDYGDTDLEMRYHFFKALGHVLKDENQRDKIDLSGVNLTHYRLWNAGKRKIDIGSDGSTLKPIAGAGSGAAQDPKTIELSLLIEKVNELFKGDLSDTDRVAFVNHVTSRMLENEHLREQARNNSKEQFRIGTFEKDLTDTVMDGLEKYGRMANQVLSSREIRQRFSAIILDLVYDKFNELPQHDG